MGTLKTQPQIERPRTEFEWGRMRITHGVYGSVPIEDVLRCLGRHTECDWGDLCEEDRRLNDKALVDGSRLLSAYLLDDGRKLWVITEAVGDDGQRAATTVLFPDEY